MHFIYLSTVFAAGPSSSDPPTARSFPSPSGLGTVTPPALGCGMEGPGDQVRARREKSSEEDRGAGPKPPETRTYWKGKVERNVGRISKCRR